MSNYIRLEVRAEVSTDSDFSPSDYIFKFAEELSGYNHIVPILEMETPTYPAYQTLADISEWDSGADYILIVRNTGSNPLEVHYESANGGCTMTLGAGCATIISDVDIGTNPSIQSNLGTTFEALICAK